MLEASLLWERSSRGGPRLKVGLYEISWLAVLAGAAFLSRSLGASADSVPPVSGPPVRARQRWREGRPWVLGCSSYRETGRCLPNFLVLGAQKAGTSTLFQLMRSHPQILEPEKKELHFFFTSNLVSVCGSPLDRPGREELLAYAERFPSSEAFGARNRSSAVTGEWSATYVVCWCCPAVVARVLPRVRLLVQLRDPIARAFARYAEFEGRVERLSKEGRPTPYFAGMTYMGFDNFVLNEMTFVRLCLEVNSSLRSTVECVAESNILGWSMYDLFLAHWLHFFSPSDLLVTYVEDLADKPLAVMRSVESHLALEAHDYSDRQLKGVYNARGAYGWEAKRLGGQAGAAGLRHRSCLDLGINFLVCDKLHDFYRPRMVELKRMADHGLISPLPPTWLDAWRLHRVL